MENLNIRQLTIFITKLIAFSVSIAVLSITYVNMGVSATFFSLLIFVLILAGVLVAQLNQQYRRTHQVIKALANGDTTLGFGADHPLRNYASKVQEQVQSARFKAEEKAQFLHALLIHIDTAILVCDQTGEVIESNPAASRLLGTSIKQLSQLPQLTAIFSETDKNFSTKMSWRYGDKLDTLSVHVSFANILGQPHRIITLNSIHDVLLSQEQLSYKNLTHVLTHEVANSITPLASIAETCQSIMPSSLSFNNDEHKQDLHLALKTLVSRTQHLGDFIEGFRQVSKLPSPDLSPNALQPIVEQTLLLLNEQITTNNIVVELMINNSPLVMIDKGQVEQVLINLIKNAIEALTTSHAPSQQLATKTIALTLTNNTSGQLYLDVFNNGATIPEHVANMMFVPFYTTKQSGSGIGLSLSKQIMINHGGDLMYLPQDDGTRFRCIFG